MTKRAAQERAVVKAAMRIHAFRIAQCNASWLGMLHIIKGRRLLAELETACAALVRHRWRGK